MVLIVNGIMSKFYTYMIKQSFRNRNTIYYRVIKKRQQI